MVGTEEELCRFARRVNRPFRKEIFAAAGKLLFPLILKMATNQLHNDPGYGYKISIEGEKNIPKNRTLIFIAPHQTHQDVKTILVALSGLTGRLVSVLNAVDGGSTRSDWRSLQLTRATPIVRINPDSELVKQQRQTVKPTMAQNAQGGIDQLVFSEGTYCPGFNDMWRLWSGGIDVADETSATIVPLMLVYGTDDNGMVQHAALRIIEPFKYDEYGGARLAAAGLRDIMIEHKKAMNAIHNPGATQSDYSGFRKAQSKIFYWDPDYKEGYKYSLDYHLAKTDRERQQIENKCQDF